MSKARKHEDLDLFARMLKVFADTPWLHYGLWLEGETPTFPKVRQAQERYVERLIALLPPAPASVLDIGGGTGAMAGRLATLGYEVEMLTPSEVQVGIAREALGDRVEVHLTRFEDFTTDKRFDVCLFSESFQYIPLEASLPRLAELLAPGGRVVIADCFRSDGYKGGREVGGGHRYADFLAALEASAFEMVENEDVTALAAPSILIDRMIYRDVLAPVVAQLGGALQSRRPAIHWLASGAYRLFVSARERERIEARLKAEYRTPERFRDANTYRFLTLRRRGEAAAPQPGQGA